MKLKELRNPHFANNKKHIFLQPIGSTEQHGPFLPFGTDTFLTDYLVNIIEKKFPKIIILPTIEYSKAEEHRGFYGTIWLQEKTLLPVFYDICFSLQKRASQIIFFTFHVDKPITTFIKQNSKKFPNTKLTNLQFFNHDDDRKIQQILSGPYDDHAGNTEISMMLAAQNQLVQIPPKNYPKHQVINPFATNNLSEKCPDGIADNHPKWIINKKIGKQILQIFSDRAISNLSINSSH